MAWDEYFMRGLNTGVEMGMARKRSAAELLQQKIETDLRKSEFDQKQKLAQMQIDADLATKGYVKSNANMSLKDAVTVGDNQYVFDPTKDMDYGYKQQQGQYYAALAKYLENQQGGVGNMDMPQGVNPDDYIMTPSVRSVRGIPTTVNSPELKPLMTGTEADAIKAASDLQNSLTLANNKSKGGVKTGFATLFNERIPFNYDLLKQFGDQNSVDLAAILKKMQSSYLSAETGSQRGFKEMTWYEPAMPTGNLPPERLQGAIRNAQQLTELNIRNMLLTVQKSGRRIGEFKDIYDALLQKYPVEEFPYGMKLEDIQGKLSGNSTEGLIPANDVLKDLK